MAAAFRVNETRSRTKSRLLYATAPKVFSHILKLPQNPHLVLHHDIISGTKTLTFEIKTSEPVSPDRQHEKTMRGYFGIMSDPDCSCKVNGNGEKVHVPTEHCLWQPKKTETSKGAPLWHLRVQVLKDQEVRGDAPGRKFVFQSMHHLTHAANQLEAAFRDSFDIKKCGVETPNAMGDRVNDGRTENVTIEYESDTAKEGWLPFLARLKKLEDEWDFEGHGEETSLL